MNEVTTEIHDYIAPADVDDTAFRSMWADFDWENKVQVNTSANDMREYVQKAADALQMKILTPESALQGDCGVMAANMHAQSVFGEHALANISLERKPTENDSLRLSGVVRIRAKSQGVALSLGKKMAALSS